MEEPNKRNWVMISTLVLVTAGFVGSLLLYLGELDRDRGAMEGRIPVIDSLLDARQRRLDDTIRRVERLESARMKEKEE